MAHFLRLDLTINGKEYDMGTDEPATQSGFEMWLTHNWIIFERDCEALRQTGCAELDLSDSENLDLLSEISGLEIEEIESAYFVMCLWNRDDETGEEEHLESLYSKSKLS